MIVKRFLKSFKVEAKWTNFKFSDEFITKRINIHELKIKTFDDLDKYAKSFIQFYMCYSCQYSEINIKILEKEIESELLSLY